MKNGHEFRIVDFPSYFSKGAAVEQNWKYAIILVLLPKYGLNRNYLKHCIPTEQDNEKNFTLS